MISKKSVDFRPATIKCGGRVRERQRQQTHTLAAFIIHHGQACSPAVRRVYFPKSARVESIVNLEEDVLCGAVHIPTGVFAVFLSASRNLEVFLLVFALN